MAPILLVLYIIVGTVILIDTSPTVRSPYRQQDVRFWTVVLSLCWYTLYNRPTHPSLQNTPEGLLNRT